MYCLYYMLGWNLTRQIVGSEIAQKISEIRRRTFLHKRNSLHQHVDAFLLYLPSVFSVKKLLSSFVQVKCTAFPHNFL